MKKTLLLSCCAPCSAAVIEKLTLEKKAFSVLFYNPNIAPFEEYEKRKEENKKLCRKYNINFIELHYDNAAWHEFIKGLEREPERGERCKKCFLFRLKKAAIYAKENNFDSFTSVLGVSKYKKLEDVNQISVLLSKEFDILFDDTNWRKNGLEERRRELIKQENLYSQKYCGCVYSQNKKP
ncbi:Uncharacterized protein conserved in bacteria DUF208 [Elusimicrobium minutum Pei191]|uniref:Epoxyqueuosine reductase QueH n=1 Tax=Elusimicrobium minutum (strain Pei191) TaxID=445932 RepID=B2KCB6_ELUMP|nr:epoxyqueuosine reductase QueH [Elusimicrobium minutum]ACC98037.1 Uncharacterized protein conserved in bacteria DUF208 [Elusimicrobium minutum Pei191]